MLAKPTKIWQKKNLLNLRKIYVKRVCKNCSYEWQKKILQQIIGKDAIGCPSKHIKMRWVHFEYLPFFLCLAIFCNETQIRFHLCPYLHIYMPGAGIHIIFIYIYI